MSFYVLDIKLFVALLFRCQKKVGFKLSVLEKYCVGNFKYRFYLLIINY